MLCLMQPAGRNTAFLNASAVPLPADDAAASPLAADGVPGPSAVADIKSQVCYKIQNLI